MEAGADDYLAKPFKMEDLVMRVHAMFRTAHIPNHIERLNQYILTIREMRAHAI
jgi:DNA-binding response OmpR family regulator